MNKLLIWMIVMLMIPLAHAVTYMVGDTEYTEETPICDDDLGGSLPACIIHTCTLSGGVLSCTGGQKWRMDTGSSGSFDLPANFILTMNITSMTKSGTFHNIDWWLNNSATRDQTSPTGLIDFPGSTFETRMPFQRNNQRGTEHPNEITGGWESVWATHHVMQYVYINATRNLSYYYEPTDLVSLGTYDGSNLYNEGDTPVYFFSKDARDGGGDDGTVVMTHIRIVELTEVVDGPPTSDGMTLNNTAPFVNQDVQFASAWSDDNGLISINNSHNFSGTQVNFSDSAYSSTTSENLTSNVTATVGGVFKFISTATDDGGFSTQDSLIVTVIDNIPSEIIEVNLSSISQIIFNSSVDRTSSDLAKHNDSTITLRIRTNKATTIAFVDDNHDLNYTDTIAYNPSSECSTTGGTFHICTITGDNATLIGVNGYSLGFKNANNNENLTGFTFQANQTNPTIPTVTINSPENNSFYVAPTNNSITFDVTSTSDFDNTLTLTMDFNGTPFYNNVSYINGTNAIVINTLAIGNWRINMIAIDSFFNLFSSFVDLRVDGLTDTFVEYGEATTQTLKFSVRSLTDTNVSPINQSTSLPAYNVTNNGTKAGLTGINMRLNKSLGDGYTYFCADTNDGKGLALTTSQQIIHSGSVAVDQEVGIYCWINLSSPISNPAPLKTLFEIT